MLKNLFTTIPWGVMLSVESWEKKQEGRASGAVPFYLSKSPLHMVEPCLPGDDWTAACQWEVLNEILVLLCLRARPSSYILNCLFLDPWDKHSKNKSYTTSLPSFHFISKSMAKLKRIAKFLSLTNNNNPTSLSMQTDELSFQNNLKFGKLPDKSDKIEQEMHDCQWKFYTVIQHWKERKKLCLFNPQFPPQH